MNTGLNSSVHGRDKHRIVKYYLIYTAVFFAFAAVIFYPFWSERKSFIYNTDGLQQHYIALMYYGRWLREIARNLIQTHRLSIPMWDFSIGYGSDIISTLSFYVIGDPLTVSSAFVPSRYTEILYNVLVILRFYLTGVSFSAFCLYMKKSRTGTLAGAVTYVFCAYALHAGIKHPFFINPMIYFPLILIGAERIFKEKKPGIFIFFVFVSALSNFYFFYMIVLGTIIYVIFRYFSTEHEKIWPGLVRTVLRFLLYGAVGLMMSMVIFLPTIMLFTDTLRSQSVQDIMIFYPLSFYKTFIKGFLTGPVNGVTYWTYLGYSWPVVPAIIMLFFRDRKRAGYGVYAARAGLRRNRSIKILFLILTAMLLIPFFGMMFNGFAYASNRWVWIYSTLISFILADTWDDMSHIFKSFRKHRYIFTSVIFALMCVHLGFNSLYRYDERWGNRISLYLDFGEAYKRLQKNMVSELTDIEESSKGGSSEEFWRYDKSRFSMRNEAMISSQNSTQSYWSLTPSSPSQFQIDMVLNPICTFNYDGLKGRTFLDELAGVKYYCAVTGSAPYGYTKLLDKEDSQSGCSIYVNDYALPIGYTYTSYLTQEQYESMDPLEKAQSMLQGVFLDDEGVERVESSGADINNIQPVTDQIRIPCTVKAGKHCSQKVENTFKVKKNKGKIKVSFEGRENCETYLLIKGFKAEGIDNSSFYRVKVKGRKTSYAYFSQNNSRLYYGEKDILINMGYYEEAQNKAVITLPYKGTYSFDSIEVICQPMDKYEGFVSELGKDTMDASMKTNEISGKISNGTDKILCLSIPWTRGWKAYLDGKEVSLMRANEMFSALYLPEGSHTIILRYRTPGLTAGILGSSAGWAAFAVILISGSKRKRAVDH